MTFKKKELEVAINWFTEMKSSLKYWKQSWKCMRNKEKDWDSFLQLCSAEEHYDKTSYSLRGGQFRTDPEHNFVTAFPFS